MFKILSETGVAAGIRRIEAATGMNAVHHVEQMDDTLLETAEALKTNPDHLLEKVTELAEQSKHKEKVINELKHKFAGNMVMDIHQKVTVIDGVQTTIAEVEGVDMEELRNISDMLKDRMGSGIVLLGTRGKEKVNFIATATKDILNKGFHAGKLIKEVAQIAGGGGGGRPDMAQAGGKKPEKLGEALEKAKEIIKNQLD